jgi:hypothetical protein
VTRVASSIWASEANQHAIEDAGLSFILGTQIPEEPYVVKQWRREHPDHDIDDGQVSTQSWPATQAQKAKGRRDELIYYQYRADRAWRTLRGIDEQVAKAEKAVAGKVSVKRNRFITLAGGEKSVNRDLEAKARGLAGSRATPPTWPTQARSSSSASTTTCGASSSPSGCPSTTYVPGRSTTTSASPSTRS